MPKASVILYVKNHEACVAAAIESVLAQSFPDFELIVVDDASTDASQAVVRRFADPRMRVFFLEAAQGKAAALNFGLQQSAGGYLAILEATDRFRPGRLQQQIGFLETYAGIGAVFSQCACEGCAEQPPVADAQDVPHAGSAAPRTRFEWLRHFFFEGHVLGHSDASGPGLSGANTLWHSSALVRRRVLADIGLYDERLSEMADLDLWIRLCMRYDLHVLPQQLAEVHLPPVETEMALSTRLRRQWEYRKTLERFQAIAPADLQRVFPESQQYGPVIEAQWIPYVLARIALAHGGAVQRHFGQDILYALLDPALGFDLPGRAGLEPVDLIRMTTAGPVSLVQEALVATAQIARLEAEIRVKQEKLETLERQRRP